MTTKAAVSAFAVCLLAVAALCAASPSSEQMPEHAHSEAQARGLWKAWKEQHNKQFEAIEDSIRFHVFRYHLDVIVKHNAEAAAGKHSFTLKATSLAHLTNAEYKAMLGYKKKQPVDAPAGVFTGEEAEGPLPQSVDWRTKGVVTPVKNQGQCGSCWAFSAVGSMEGAHALATGNLVSLSEQELVDCVLNGADTCQTGGFQQQGYAYVIKAGGEESESEYPYTATSGNKCQFKKSEVKATFSSWKNVTHGNETALAYATVARPTVAVAIDASSMWFQLYSSGVYNDASCHNKVDQLDHGVLVVGYGMDGSTPYWLVKNSWGAGWGQQGYIWMSKDKNNQCGIATDASFALV